MAIYYARKSGNVNASDVWATTPSGTASDVFSIFTNQDVLISNSFTVTLNVNTNVAEIRNDATGGATQGGTFSLNGGITLVSNIYSNATATTAYCLTFTGTSDAYIIGSIYGGSNTSGMGVSISTSFTLNITGNIYGGTGSNCWGLRIQSSNGKANITGNVIGGIGSNANGVVLETNGVVNITGTVSGGYGGYGVSNVSAGGTINIIGTSVGGPSNGGTYNSSTGIIIMTRAKGNGYGPGSVGMSSVVGAANSQTGTMKVYEIEYGDLGQSPTSGPIEMISANSNVAVFAVRLSTKKTLVDLNNSTNLIPSSGNVRSGTSYNYGNNIGSCAIPNPNSVVYGVPVDNTVGSGLLSPVAVWNALTSSIGTSGSIGERLKNCSTVSTVGKQLEGVL